MELSQKINKLRIENDTVEFFSSPTHRGQFEVLWKHCNSFFKEAYCMTSLFVFECLKLLSHKNLQKLYTNCIENEKKEKMRSRILGIKLRHISNEGLHFFFQKTY